MRYFIGLRVQKIIHTICQKIRTNGRFGKEILKLI